MPPRRRLRAWHPSTEELTRRSSSVELLQGDRVLQNEEEVEEEAILQAYFSIKPVECSSLRSSGLDADSLLVVDVSFCRSIRERAFQMCTSLAQVRIPRSVSRIDIEAFKGCSQLMELTLPKSLTHIEAPRHL